MTYAQDRMGRFGVIRLSIMTMVLLYSNSLYFLWHVTKLFIQGNGKANGHLPF